MRCYFFMSREAGGGQLHAVASPSNGDVSYVNVALPGLSSADETQVRGRPQLDSWREGLDCSTEDIKGFAVQEAGKFGFIGSSK